MPGARQIKAGGAYVELSAQDKLSGALKAVGARVKQFGAGVAAAGAAMFRAGAIAATALAAGLGAAVKVASDLGMEIVEASERTGASVESLSALKFAAEQTGAGLSDVEKGLRMMNKVLLKADEDGKAAAHALGRLGIKVEDIKGLAPEEQFKRIAAGLAKVEDGGQRSAIAMAVFGKGGTALLPMLSNVEALTKAAGDLGLVMDEKSAEAAAAFGKQVKALGDQLKMIGFRIGSLVIPFLSKLATWAEVVLAKFINWLETPGVVDTIQGALEGLWNGIVRGGAAVEVVFSHMGDIMTALGQVWDHVAIDIGDNLRVLTENFQEAWRFVGDLIQNVLDTAQTNFKTFLGNAAGMLARFADMFMHAWRDLLVKGPLAGTSAKDLVATFQKELGGLNAGFVNAQVTAPELKKLPGFGGAAGNIFGHLFGKLGPEIEQRAKELSDFFAAGIMPKRKKPGAIDEEATLGEVKRISQGTFSAAAAMRFGGRGKDPVVNAIDAGNRHLKDIKDILQDRPDVAFA